MKLRAFVFLGFLSATGAFAFEERHYFFGVGVCESVDAGKTEAVHAEGSASKPDSARAAALKKLEAACRGGELISYELKPSPTEYEDRMVSCEGEGACRERDSSKTRMLSDSSFGRPQGARFDLLYLLNKNCGPGKLTSFQIRCE